MDKIFYPDRSATEVSLLNQEWAEFVAAMRTADPILWPDLDTEEANRLYQEGQEFFNTVIRRNRNR